MGSHCWCDQQPSELSVIQLSVIMKKDFHEGVYADDAGGADHAGDVVNGDDADHADDAVDTDDADDDDD